MEYKIDFEKINRIHPTDESKEKIREEIKDNKRTISAVYNGLNSHLEATCELLYIPSLVVVAYFACKCFNKISQNHSDMVSIILSMIIAILMEFILCGIIRAINETCIKIYSKNLIIYILSDCIYLASQHFIAEDEKINLAMYYFTLYNTNFDMDKAYSYISNAIKNP
jgi:hypothetical protein